MTEMEVEGLDELQALIERFPELALDAAEPALIQTLLYLHGRLPSYPPKPALGTASNFWTPKQQRWFWWAVKRGGVPGMRWVEEEDGGHVEGEYRRTGTLGRRITEETTRDADGVTGELGMNTPYAPWVVGPPESDPVSVDGQQMYQARVHEGRWWRFGDVVEENLDAAYELFQKQFFEELMRAYGSAESGGTE